MFFFQIPLLHPTNKLGAILEIDFFHLLFHFTLSGDKSKPFNDNEFLPNI